MKKKVTIIAVSGLCVICAAIGACAATAVQSVTAELRPDFTIVIDGEQRTFKNANGETVDPILYNGSTYLPIRAIGEIMGKTVYWYEDEKKVELKSEGTTVTDADVIVPSGGSGGAASGVKITEDRARQIALEKAGLADGSGVKFGKTQLDRDNGRLHYDIEFYTTNADGTLAMEYDAEIDADTGEVIKFETEQAKNAGTPGNTTAGTGSADSAASGAKITAEEAQSIALKRAGMTAEQVRFDRTELDREHGTLVYEVEFKTVSAAANGRRMEYSAEISASDGSVLKWDAEYDD